LGTIPLESVTSHYFPAAPFFALSAFLSRVFSAKDPRQMQFGVRLAF
jgi:hypothetical protein